MFNWLKNLFKKEVPVCVQLRGKSYLDSTIFKATERWGEACYYIVTKKDYEESLRQANEKNESVMILNWHRLSYREANKLIGV